MSDQLETYISDDKETDSVGTFVWLDRHTPRGPKVFSSLPAKGAATPIKPASNTPLLDGRICIFDSDPASAADLGEVLESIGHEVLVINEIIGASNRIRAFCPEIIIIEVANSTLPGTKLMEILRRNLGELPHVILFTSMPRAELVKNGLGDLEWHPKSRGMLTLVNRIRVLLMYDRTGRQEQVPRA